MDKKTTRNVVIIAVLALFVGYLAVDIIFPEEKVSKYALQSSTTEITNVKKYENVSESTSFEGNKIVTTREITINAEPPVTINAANTPILSQNDLTVLEILDANFSHKLKILAAKNKMELENINQINSPSNSGGVISYPSMVNDMNTNQTDNFTPQAPSVAMVTVDESEFDADSLAEKTYSDEDIDKAFAGISVGSIVSGGDDGISAWLNYGGLIKASKGRVFGPFEVVEITPSAIKVKHTKYNVTRNFTQAAFVAPLEPENLELVDGNYLSEGVKMLPPEIDGI